MTEYATHRFSVGQEVTKSGETRMCCRVIALVMSSDGPEYKIKHENSEVIVAERELTYRAQPRSGAR